MDVRRKWRVVRHLLPRKAVNASFLEVFKARSAWHERLEPDDF